MEFNVDDIIAMEAGLDAAYDIHMEDAAYWAAMEGTNIEAWKMKKATMKEIRSMASEMNAAAKSKDYKTAAEKARACANKFNELSNGIEGLAQSTSSAVIVDLAIALAAVVAIAATAFGLAKAGKHFGAKHGAKVGAENGAIKGVDDAKAYLAGEGKERFAQMGNNTLNRAKGTAERSAAAARKGAEDAAREGGIKRAAELGERDYNARLTQLNKKLKEAKDAAKKAHNGALNKSKKGKKMPKGYIQSIDKKHQESINAIQAEINKLTARKDTFANSVISTQKGFIEHAAKAQGDKAADSARRKAINSARTNFLSKGSKREEVITKRMVEIGRKTGEAAGAARGAAVGKKAGALAGAGISGTAIGSFLAKKGFIGKNGKSRHELQPNDVNALLNMIRKTCADGKRRYEHLAQMYDKMASE